LFEDDIGADWRDTVRHEIAHACVFSTYGQDVRPHGEGWQEAARRAGADPSARYEGADLVDAEYVLACPDGCYERGSLKRSKRVKYPWKYACPECETLVSCDGDTSPTDCEPGTCAVESIPWTEPHIIHACPNGCFSVGYAQHCDETRTPDQYRCGECDARTISYPADQRP